jgi:hypothetical protein
MTESDSKPLAFKVLSGDFNDAARKFITEEISCRHCKNSFTPGVHLFKACSLNIIWVVEAVGQLRLKLAAPRPARSLTRCPGMQFGRIRWCGEVLTWPRSSAGVGWESECHRGGSGELMLELSAASA